MKHALPNALLLAALSGFGCSPRPPVMARGIELEEPSGSARTALGAEAADPDSALVASAAEPRTPSSEHGDGQFVYSRSPPVTRANGAQLPIHINDTWWPFRARQLGTGEPEVKQRDARVGAARAPVGFWDSQTAVEAVSVWTVLCNQCHGGRRHLEDLAEMPDPPPDWGKGTGLFFGKRRAYSHLFNVVQHGGPLKEDGRVGMPAWKTILSNEMIWALLYFLEYQSGGIESHFPPSLYPRPPRVIGEP